MEDYKEDTMRAYDAFPDYFDEKFGEYTNNVIQKELKEIVRRFPRGAKMLDVGSGTGNHALFFKQHGFDVLCLDNSDAMLEKCREKGLATVKMDMEDMRFPEQHFQIVWAYTSLLHIPKTHVPSVLLAIQKILKPGAFLVLSLKEGIGEGFVPFKKGGMRWFSRYTDEEIRALVHSDFEIVKHWRVSLADKSKVFLDYLCRKRYRGL